ncbi:MAG: ABC transporter ATP-binding protein [Candidatus Yonathbacteria bacterium]|nr:ABC transporter ATP-binding protein [Candidatus Yonathbacteria bacterium]
MEDKNNKLTFLKFLGTLRWVFVYNAKLAPFAVFSYTIANIFQRISPLINAYIFARLLDDVIKIVASHGSSKEIIPMLGILLAYNLINSMVSSAKSYFGTVIRDATLYKSPQILHQHIYSLGIQTLENPEVVNKIQRAREALFFLGSDLEQTITVTAYIITLITSALIVIRIIPLVAIIVFVSILPEMISNRYHLKKAWKLYHGKTEHRRKASFVFDSLTQTSNLHEITVTSAYEYLSDVYRQFADWYMEKELAILKRMEYFSFSFGSMTSIASIFGYFIILKNLFNGAVSVGGATFQMRALDTFVNILQSVGDNYVTLTERCLRINEIKEVFDMKPMISDGDVEMVASADAPNIAFKGVSFKYLNSERFVIQDMDIEIKPGEKIAIVGENGAGKTTLVKLLSRFYKVDKGGIYLNEQNLNDIKIDSWYKNLGVLFQDYNTYGSLTLKENIFLGDSQREFNEAKMETAANKANVNSFISNYKNGYEQVLSEKFKGGTRPSTGQWQKIAIARFFYRDSPVVIFDEPTASIDAVSEAEIFGHIYEFFKKKTVIIISHRFSTVRNADRIYVMDGGKIAERGNHDQLMSLKGKYYKAFNIQAGGYN